MGPHKVINTSAPKVVHLSPSSPRVARYSKSIEIDSNFDHAPIGQYLQCREPLMLEVDVESKLEIVVAISMNFFQPPIEDLFTCQVTQGKRPTNQITTTFVGEHNDE